MSNNSKRPRQKAGHVAKKMTTKDGASSKTSGEKPPIISLTISDPKTWKRMFWGIGATVAIVAIIWLLTKVRAVSMPLAIGFIIAYIFDPMADWMQEKGLKRTPAVLIIFAGLTLMMLTTVLLIVPQLINEFSQVPDQLESLLTQLGAWAEKNLDIKIPSNIDLAEIPELIRQVLPEGFEFQKLSARAQAILSKAFGGAFGLFGAVATLIMTPIFAFFMLRDYDDLMAFLKDNIPRSMEEPMVRRFQEIDEALSSFIRGQLTVAGILGGLYTLGLFIVGAPLALVIGLISGLGNMIPYLGTTVGMALAAGLVLVNDPTPFMFLKVLGVFAVVQGLEGWVITPKIVGDSVDLSPFIVIVAILFFGDLFGFVGILLAVPLAAVAKILGRVLLEAYRESEFYRGT